MLCITVQADQSPSLRERLMRCKYKIILYWSEDDHAYIAEVPKLPCCAADGKTYEQALTNVEGIIQE